MKLKLRFLLLMTAVFTGFVLITWFVSLHQINEINQKWGSQFIERQVAFDKYRTLSPLIHEIALARKMAADPDIIQMALHERNPILRQRGIAAMESYRFNFRDHSYFTAISSSGNYYFNDAANQYQGKQLRYVLSPTNANDKWFYATIEDGREYQVNLDPDVHLGVTKVWINVLIKNGRNILGVVGTGIDLTAFLQDTVSISQQGVHNLFIDKSMAIQLNANPDLIDYMSIAKSVSHRIKVDVLLKNPDDINRLQLAIRQLDVNPDRPQTFWVNYGGERKLLGVAYLPEIGWYDLTLMDTHGLVLIEDKFLAPVLFCAAFLMALMIMGYALHRWVIRPISALQESTNKVQQGDFDIDFRILGSGEISHLSQSFVSMVNYINDMHRELENKVNKRTDELIHLSKYEKFRSCILELIAGDISLGIILEAIVQGVEQLNPAMICSILLLSSDGKHLGKGVAPSLPDFYNAALDGVEIGVGVGSCGTAAFTGERVIVEDISTHPYWVSYKELASRAGLGACWSQPIRSSTGQVLGTFAIYHHEAHMPVEADITLIEQSANLISIAIERKQDEEVIRQSEIKFRTLYDSTSDAVQMLDEKGFFDCNKATLTLFGCASKEEFCAHHPANLSPPKQPNGMDSMDLANQHIATAMKEGSARFEWIHTRADTGQSFSTEVLLSSMKLDGKLVLQATVRDISNLKDQQRQLERMAHHDALTGLPNRTLLNDRLEMALAQAKRSGGKLAACFMDLDGFKPVNDTFGHETGDLLLVEVARRMLAISRATDTVARLGGDEFVLIFQDISDGTECRQMLSRVMDSIGQPFNINGHDIRISASIGAAFYPDDDADGDNLLRHADQAMYVAKQAGRNQFHFFDAVDA